MAHTVQVHEIKTRFLSRILTFHTSSVDGMAEINAAGVGHEHNNGTSPKPGTPHGKNGWDGKLRVNKQASLANPEALSDPEYSDEDAPPVDQIAADEGVYECDTGTMAPGILISYRLA